jgi:hypothetical protein|tara:strand:+ start:1106 stop:1327 length:222 start_codon:yes stop_codon:yes gene_type:complete
MRRLTITLTIFSFISCSTLHSVKKPTIKLSKVERVERCIKDLIGRFEVAPLEASKICIDIRTKKSTIIIRKLP